jgi:hypothetical protein
MAAMAGPPAPPPPPSGFHKKDLWGPYPVDDEEDDDEVDCFLLCNMFFFQHFLECSYVALEFNTFSRTFESVINVIEFPTLGREFA